MIRLDCSPPVPYRVFYRRSKYAQKVRDHIVFGRTLDEAVAAAERLVTAWNQGGTVEQVYPMPESDVPRRSLA